MEIRNDFFFYWPCKLFGFVRLIVRRPICTEILSIKSCLMVSALAVAAPRDCRRMVITFGGPRVSGAGSTASRWRGVFCKGCKRTISYLPHFVLTYRVLHIDLVEAFLDGQALLPSQERWRDLLRSYYHRFREWIPRVRRTIGSALGLTPLEGFWPWLKEACGSLASATRQLVATWKTTLFGCYRCHQTGQE